MYGRRVIVPHSLRREVLQGLHSAHQGVAKMSDRSQDVVFWPGLFKDIEQIRAECAACDTNAPSQSPLPPEPLESPEYPFQYIVADYCTVKAKSWLVIADRFTGWVSVYYFPREATAADLNSILQTYFSTFGVAENISTDDGSQFRSKAFQDFIKKWGVATHRTSSAYFPHSNLRAETAVNESTIPNVDRARWVVPFYLT